MNLIQLSDEELVKSDERIHGMAYTDENLIHHADIITEMLARGLTHADQSAFSKATEWWLTENPRFSGSISLWEVEEDLPGAALDGAIRKRGAVGPNEFIDIVVKDNAEAVDLVSKCHRPDIMARINFVFGPKPIQPGEWVLYKTAMGKNEAWHKFIGARISKGLLVFGDTGEYVQLVKSGELVEIFNDLNVSITRLHNNITTEAKKLPDGVYFGNIKDKLFIEDCIRPGSTKYSERMEFLSTTLKGFEHVIFSQPTPVSARSSLEKALVGHCFIRDPNSNDGIVVYDPEDEIIMDICKFAGDKTVCKVCNEPKYPIDCFLGDTYICPLVKDIYYEV